MKNLKYFGAAVIIVLLVSAIFIWATTVEKEQKDPMKDSDAYVYSDDGMLSWFKLTSQKERVEGTLHHKEIREEIGKVPILEEKTYSLTGKATEKGYEFKVNHGEQTVVYDGWLSDKDLLVQQEGEKDSKLYKAVDEVALNEYVNELQRQLQIAIDQSEKKEKDRLNKFFSDLERVYGYFYSAEDGSFQLFLKIDEALHQGELTGSLLMMGGELYEETRYDLNGITDGLMVEFFTTVDGKATKLKGNFHEDASGLDLSFWTTDEKLPFDALTEEEFEQSYKEFKARVER